MFQNELAGSFSGIVHWSGIHSKRLQVQIEATLRSLQNFLVFAFFLSRTFAFGLTKFRIVLWTNERFDIVLPRNAFLAQKCQENHFLFFVLESEMIHSQPIRMHRKR